MTTERQPTPPPEPLPWAASLLPEDMTDDDDPLASVTDSDALDSVPDDEE